MKELFYAFIVNVLKSIFPILIIAVAIITSFKPTIFGMTFTKENLIMALFSFLAIDSIINRYELKTDVIKKLSTIEKKLTQLKANTLLKKRQDFQRLELIFSSTKKTLLVSGITLEGLVPSCTIIKEKLKSGCNIKLLMLDPNGKTLDSASKMSGVSVDKRKLKIKVNMDYLLEEFKEYYKMNLIELKLIDNVLPFSFIGIDTDNPDGKLIVQHYLFQSPSELSPMLELTQDNRLWYNLYLEQWKKMWNSGRNPLSDQDE